MKRFFALFFLPLMVFALPQGLHVEEGTASQRVKESTLHITNSPQAILNWETFSIGKGETVHFAQEHAHSLVLNRVFSKECSYLLGRLTSNGGIFLINPNGVWIGKHHCLYKWRD